MSEGKIEKIDTGEDSWADYQRLGAKINEIIDHLNTPEKPTEPVGKDGLEGVRKILEKLAVANFQDPNTIMQFRMQETIDEAISAIRKFIKEKLDTLIKDRYLTKNNLAHQLIWIEGHKIAIKEAKELFSIEEGV